MQVPVTMRATPTCCIDSVRFSPDGRHLAMIECRSSSFELVCFEVATGREVFRRDVGHHWYALAWAGPSTLAAWAEKRGSRDDTSPWTVEFYAVPAGRIVARHTLPGDVLRSHSPHLLGARDATRVLAATTRGDGSGAGAPGRGWILDATTGAVVRGVEVASVLPPGCDGPLSRWALSPDGERAAVSSFVGTDRDDDVLHCFGPEGASLLAKGRLHEPEWIDDRTVLTRGQVADEQTICVACVGEETPRFRVRSPTTFALGAVGPDVALYDAATQTFFVRSPRGDDRVLGARAPFDAEWCSPRWTFLATNIGGATRVLAGSVDKLPASKRAGVPGAEEGAAPPMRGVSLTDALTGDTVLVHGVDTIKTHNLHGLFYPLELHVDPSGRSLALVVRRTVGTKQYAPEHHHLVVCDVAAVLSSLAPRKPPKKPRATK